MGRSKYIYAAVCLLAIGVVFQFMNASAATGSQGRFESYSEGGGQAIILEAEDIAVTSERIAAIQANTSGITISNIPRTPVGNGAAYGTAAPYVHVHLGGNGELTSSNVCHQGIRREEINHQCGYVIVWEGPYYHGTGYQDWRYVGWCPIHQDRRWESGGVGPNPRAPSGTCDSVVSTTYNTYYTLSCTDTNKTYGTVQIFNGFNTGGVKETVLFAGVTPTISGIRTNPGITVNSYSWTGPSGGIKSGANTNSVTVQKNGTYTCTVSVKDKLTEQNANISASISVTNLR